MRDEHSDKIGGAERGELDNGNTDAKKALESNHKRTVEHARHRLTHASRVRFLVSGPKPSRRAMNEIACTPGKRGSR